MVFPMPFLPFGGQFAGDEQKDKPDGVLFFAGTPIHDETVSQKPDSFVKKPSYGAQASRSEAYLCTPQRLRGAAQRGNWVFCGTVSHRGF
jgi:hypothetical protein